MLAKLLERIAQGGTFSVQALAQEIGVSKALLEAMLADLERAGYLHSVQRCGESKCSGCSTAASCRSQAKVWLRAEKGRENS